MTKNPQIEIDMSPLAVARRLEQVRRLVELARYLRQFKPANPSSAVDP